MDDGTNPQGGPDISAAPDQQAPAGVTFDSSPQQGNTPSTDGGPPAGVTFDNSPLAPAVTASQGMHDVGQMVKGAGHGLASTLSGIARGISVNPMTAGAVPQSAIDFLDQHADNNATNSRDRLSQGIGYGGETLAEFLTGDEAFQALSESEKLMQSGKIMKVLEKSPRLIEALKRGVTGGAKAGARAAALQGTQTFARTGDPKAAAEDAAIAGGAGAALGTVTNTAAETLGRAHDIAETVPGLTEAAGKAETKEAVAKSIGDKLDVAKDQLHADYEGGINDLQGKLQGQTVDPKANPLQKKASDLLQDNPMPDEDPTARQIKNAAGDKLDTKTKEILTSISRGELPITDEDIKAAEVANQPSGIVDANGRATTPEPVEPHGQPRPPYDIKGLVDIRQSIRNLADKYEYGDVNSRVLRSLINDVPSNGGAISNPMDQTIEQMAQNSGNQGAIDDYKDLRSDYRNKINVFDDPVIQNLRDNKVADAARSFVGITRANDALPGTGKVPYNVNNLRTLIGDPALKSFGKQVFGTIMKDSVKGGRFNPAFFMDSMNKITPETKDGLFDLKNANSGLQELYQDAQSAAKLQHLTRVGVLVPTATVAGGAFGHVGAGIGTILGLTVAEGGGIKAGRQLLDYVANHPAVWGTYKYAGKIANSKTAEVAATATRGAAAQGGSRLREALQGTRSSLSEKK